MNGLGLWELIVCELVILAAGLGVVRARYAPGPERLGGYVLVTSCWTVLQVVGFGLDLYGRGLL